MKSLSRNAAEPLWEQFWEQMRSEWFKLEVLQDYSAEDEGPSLKKWLAGDFAGSLALMSTDQDEGFSEKCRQKLATGVKLLRIHLTEAPLTPYMKWEIEYYKRVNVRLRGETVYLLAKDELKPLALPAGDVMIFDGRRAVVNQYGARGLMLSETFYDESDDISELLELRQKVLALLPNKGQPIT